MISFSFGNGKMRKFMKKIKHTMNISLKMCKNYGLNWSICLDYDQILKIKIGLLCR